MDTTQLQSEYSDNFEALGFKHELVEDGLLTAW
jgi:hypothetical protein